LLFVVSPHRPYAQQHHLRRLLLRRKHDPINAEVMFVAHRLYTYPLEKSEVSDAAIVVERN
jgi:hypothetical protein